MDRGRSPWQDGRRAWARLEGWHQAPPSGASGGGDDGAGALAALDDVGALRHLLDQAELVAVRTARRRGKSWAEIAVKLGVSRQSAWERWHELDAETAIDQAVPELVKPAAREWRRRSLVVVPSVIGLPIDQGERVLRAKDLFAVGSDPDGPPLAASAAPDQLITDQSPESGAKVPPGSTVTLWLDAGGGSAGVREPRRPRPNPKVGREMHYEPSDEAVS